MTEKSPMGTPTDISPAGLRQQCSAASNRSARVSLGLEKLAVRVPDRRTADQARALASTVADFVNEMDVLSVLLEGAGDSSLSTPSRRRLGSLTSDAEELASLTSSLVGRGEMPGGARLEKLAETKATWEMMLQLVAAFQSLVQIQDEEDAAQVLEMTGSDFEELQRLIAQVQLEPSPSASEALPPDYDTAVCSPSPSTTSSSYPLDHKQPIASPAEYNQPSASSSSSTPSSSRPKRGKVGGFFRSISSKFAAPVEPLVTPLCRAAEAGDTQNLKGLLGQGANPNGINEEGYTPLTSAIHSTSNPDIPATVRLLLSSGADPSVRDAVWSLPPLWHASRAGRADVASLLLDAGADPRGRNSYGAPYFAEAAEKDPLPLIELLLRRGADPDAANLTGRKVVVSAVEHNDMARTRVLLEGGATVSATNTTGHSLIAIAVANRNLDLVTYLIGRGANANGRNGFGEALLSLAVFSFSIDIARLLLTHGADPNSKSLTGQPCLVSALPHDLPDTTRLLLEHGADPNAKDITGRPILAMAVSQKRYAHATLLLEHGADPSIAGNRSGSAHLITTHLRNKSPDQPGFLRLMLRQGANPNVMPSSWDGHGGSANTPLGYCVSESLPELVAILVAAGADPHRAGQTGTVPFSDPLGKNTPFRLAAVQGRVGCLKAMLEGGAAAKLRGKTGVDADEVLLQAAAAAGENREVVEMLLDEGVERPAWAAAFTEREGGEALRAAVQDRASKMGVEGGWLQVRRGTTAVQGDAPPPPY